MSFIIKYEIFRDRFDNLFTVYCLGSQAKQPVDPPILMFYRLGENFTSQSKTLQECMWNPDEIIPEAVTTAYLVEPAEATTLGRQAPSGHGEGLETWKRNSTQGVATNSLPNFFHIL